MNYSENLANIRNLNTEEFKGLNGKFKVIIEDNFLNKILIDNKKYKITSSTGQGQLAKIWWAAIFDIDFYKEYYNIKKVSSVGASLGYYVVYLLNEDKTKVYLTLAQASAGFSKNKIKRNQMLSRNLYIQNHIFKDVEILKSIEFKLSKNKIEKARDYELSVLLAKEYDLLISHDNSEFENDLNNFLKYYSELISFLIENPIIQTEKEILTFKYTGFKNDINTKELIEEIINEENEQERIQEATPYFDKDDLNRANNRKPKTIKKESSNYYRDPRVAKTVLVLNQYKCECYSGDKSFNTSDNHIYAEAHHLIPMKFQKEFHEFNLDRTDNIVSLCPICHNAIHYGNLEEKFKRLRILFEKKENQIFFSTLKIENFDLFYKKFYKTKKT